MTQLNVTAAITIIVVARITKGLNVHSSYVFVNSDEKRALREARACFTELVKDVDGGDAETLADIESAVDDGFYELKNGETVVLAFPAVNAQP